MRVATPDRPKGRQIVLRPLCISRLSHLGQLAVSFNNRRLFLTG